MRFQSLQQPGKRLGFKYAVAAAAVGALLSGMPAFAQVTPVEIVSGAPELFSSRVLTTQLENPWAMAWGPDNKIWVTERTAGRVTRVDPATGQKFPLLTIEEVFTGIQHEGLFGLVMHPDFMQDKGSDYVYLAYTVNDGTAEAPAPSAKVVRYTYNATSEQLEEPLTLIQNIPAGDDHNAGRLVIGPDLKLYYSLGEQGRYRRPAGDPIRAQILPTQEQVAAEDWYAYSGKVLRLELDGSIPADNPELDGVVSHVFTYGHRNPQGLVFAPNGVLYESEHGPNSDDELNILVAGGNYGWPNVSGYLDDRAYDYPAWHDAPADLPRNSASVGQVPTTAESDFKGEVVEPIAAYFTVDEVVSKCGFICNPTIAPGSAAYYSAGENGIAEWDNSILLPTLKHGVVYVQKLSEDGLTAEGAPVAWLSTQNRYRDILVAPDGVSVFVATDAFGAAAQKFGEDLTTGVLHNPGAIMLFTYEGK